MSAEGEGLRDKHTWGERREERRCECVRAWEGEGGAGCAQCCPRRPRRPPRGPCSPRRRARPSPAGDARPCGLFGARGHGADPPFSGRAGAGGDGDLRLPLNVGQRALHGGVILLRGARALSAAGSGVRCARALTGFRGGVRWRMPEGRSTVGTCVGETQGEGCVWQESPRAREHRPPAGLSLALAATASGCSAGCVRGRVSCAAPAQRQCASNLYGKGRSAGGKGAYSRDG